ncbi:MAG: hypothetical protein MJK14_11095 [Rivularia sp. ALOHA_DT_140]|nr:hypothetical protein [Rivularia sp. ALOHA_DT_140]
MNSWKQVRIPLLAFTFTAVILVLIRVILVTASSTKQKKNSELPLIPLQTVAIVEANNFLSI